MTPDTFDEQAAALREIMDRHHGYGTLWMDALREAHALGRASGCEHVKRCYCAMTILPTIAGSVATVHVHGARHTEKECGVTDDQRAGVSGERDGERESEPCGLCGHTLKVHQYVAPPLCNECPPNGNDEHEFVREVEAWKHRNHPSCFEGCDTLQPETCVCDHPHGECVTCGCRLLTPPPTDRNAGREAAEHAKWLRETADFLSEEGGSLSEEGLERLRAIADFVEAALKGGGE